MFSGILAIDSFDGCNMNQKTCHFQMGHISIPPFPHLLFCGDQGLFTFHYFWIIGNYWRLFCPNYRPDSIKLVYHWLLLAWDSASIDVYYIFSDCKMPVVALFGRFYFDMPIHNMVSLFWLLFSFFIWSVFSRCFVFKFFALVTSSIIDGNIMFSQKFFVFLGPLLLLLEPR